jgi:hypothetical protein
MSNRDADWYLGDIVNQPVFAREHHELLALVAHGRSPGSRTARGSLRQQSHAEVTS